MTGPDAMHSEMPGFFPGRPGGERDEPLLDMIFDRRPLPPGAPPEMHDLARLLTAVAGPAEPGELAGEATVLAAFARHAFPADISPAASRPARRWLSGRPARARLPLAAALVTAAAGLGGITAAYAGVLPGPIQHFAHDSFGAPPPPGDKSRPSSAVTAPRASVNHATRTPFAQPAHSAAPAQVPGSASSPQPRHGASGHDLRTAAPSCTPRPTPTRTLARPGPVQSPPAPGAANWNPRSPGVPGCPTIVSRYTVPRP
jgi:hypothetical protein